jgi:hypothetical protein
MVGKLIELLYATDKEIFSFLKSGLGRWTFNSMQHLGVKQLSSHATAHYIIEGFCDTDGISRKGENCNG